MSLSLSKGLRSPELSVAPSTQLYKPRRPQDTLLYEIVSQNIETWLARKREACPWDDPVPPYLESAWRKFLTCGIACHGFARIKCQSCEHEQIVAFSCKTRHLCPSCAAKRMAATAAHLIDNVIPLAPARQWVLTLPRRLRYFLAHDGRVARAVNRIFLRAVRFALRLRTPDAPPDASFAAIGFFHRFGTYINRHSHFHDAVIDGLFSLDGDTLVFHEAHLVEEDIIGVQSKVRVRVLRHLERRGCIDTSTAQEMLSWDHDAGFSVDGSVLIPSWDRPGLERLLRYCSRPSFSLDRLFRIDDEHVGYAPRKPTMDGRSHIIFTNMQLLDAISALIPPPHVNSHSYFGAFAPHSRLRAHMNGAGPGLSTEMMLEKASSKMGLDERPRSEWSRMWAMLLARIFEVLPLVCSRCGSEMAIISFHTDTEEVRDYLLRAGLDPNPPPIAPARDPPQVAMELEQSVAPEDWDQSLDAPDYDA